MALIPISGTDRDIPTAIGIHDEDGRARHLGADAESDPLICAWGLDGEVDSPWY
jgi:hypothetical protein